MKFKALAAAVALMSAASVANADWNDGKNSLSGVASGNGELILIAFDEINSVSVIQDLGSSYMDFYNNSQDNAYSFSADLDALFGSTFSDPANVMWTVMAVNNGSTLSSNTNRTASGWMTTVNPGEDPTNMNHGTAGLGNILTKIDSNLSPAANTGGNGDWAENFAVEGNLDNGLYAGDVFIYGNYALDASPFQVTATAAESMYFWAYETSYAGSEQTQFVGQWSLDLAAGTVKYVATPVPAAIWLLASGLLGLGAISRRRKA